MKHCPKCSLDFPSSSTFCKRCGAALTDDESTAVFGAPQCPSCKAEVAVGSAACSSCGHELAWAAAAPASPSEQARICPLCGTDNPADSLFCRECGQGMDVISGTGQLDAERAAPPPTVFMNSTQPASETGAFSQEPHPACPNCGSWSRPGLRFCERCGKPLGTDGLRPASRRRSRKALFIAAACIVLLGAVSLFWLLWGVGLSVRSSPAGARIFVDDEEVGQTSLTDGSASVAHLGRGQHTVRIERDGFLPFTQTLDFGLFDFSRSVEARLEPSVFTLTVVTDPPGCRVTLDAGERGMTDDTRGELILSAVARGQHSLTLSRPGYQDWTEQITLDSSQLVRASLTPIAEEPMAEESEVTSPHPDNNSSSSAGEVESALRGWARTLSNKDLEGNIGYYADHLDTFLTMSDVTRDQVRAARIKLFEKYSSLDLQLSNFHINLDPSGTRAVVTVDTKYEFTGSKQVVGSAQDEISLEKMGGRWLITNEKHIQKYYGD